MGERRKMGFYCCRETLLINRFSWMNMLPLWVSVWQNRRRRKRTEMSHKYENMKHLLFIFFSLSFAQLLFHYTISFYDRNDKIYSFFVLFSYFAIFSFHFSWLFVVLSALTDLIWCQFYRLHFFEFILFYSLRLHIEIIYSIMFIDFDCILEYISKHITIYNNSQRKNEPRNLFQSACLPLKMNNIQRPHTEHMI